MIDCISSNSQMDQPHWLDFGGILYINNTFLNPLIYLLTTYIQYISRLNTKLLFLLGSDTVDKLLSRVNIMTAELSKACNKDTCIVSVVGRI